MEDGKMSSEVPNDVSIEIVYGAGFRRQVTEQDEADPLTTMKIKVGEIYVVGGPEPGHGSGDYMTNNLIEQFNAIERVREGERYILEFSTGPSFLVFEPMDGSIMVTGCVSIEGARDPKKRHSVDTTGVVSLDAWIDEVVRVAKEYSQALVDANPSLQSSSELQLLRETINKVN